jgi:hypothetical protein
MYQQLMLLYALQIGKLLRCASHLLTFYRFTFFKISITVKSNIVQVSKHMEVLVYHIFVI